MPTFYDIYQLSPESPDYYEQLGSKPKFWFRLAGDNQPWLFKYAREGTGEAWAEKVAAEVAELLGTPHAVVELAVFSGKNGCMSRSFVERNKGFDLIHGSEVLAGFLSSYDKGKIRRQSAHCLNNIIQAAQAAIDPAIREEQMRIFAGYFVLDALIINVDRHHDNWGLLREEKPGNAWAHVLAPSFDHASALGREMQDVRREKILADKKVPEYVLRGTGAIYLNEQQAKGENPLLLVEGIYHQYESWLRPWIEKIKALEEGQFQRILNNVPDTLMSKTAKLFAKEMIKFTLSRLRRLVP